MSDASTDPISGPPTPASGSSSSSISGSTGSEDSSVPSSPASSPAPSSAASNGLSDVAQLSNFMSNNTASIGPFLHRRNSTGNLQCERTTDSSGRVREIYRLGELQNGMSVISTPAGDIHVHVRAVQRDEATRGKQAWVNVLKDRPPPEWSSKGWTSSSRQAATQSSDMGRTPSPTSTISHTGAQAARASSPFSSPFTGTPEASDRFSDLSFETGTIPEIPVSTYTGEVDKTSVLQRLMKMPQSLQSSLFTE